MGNTQKISQKREDMNVVLFITVCLLAIGSSVVSLEGSYELSDSEEQSDDRSAERINLATNHDSTAEELFGDKYFTGRVDGVIDVPEDVDIDSNYELPHSPVWIGRRIAAEDILESRDDTNYAIFVRDPADVDLDMQTLSSNSTLQDSGNFALEECILQLTAAENEHSESRGALLSIGSSLKQCNDQLSTLNHTIWKYFPWLLQRSEESNSEEKNTDTEHHHMSTALLIADIVTEATNNCTYSERRCAELEYRWKSWD